MNTTQHTNSVFTIELQLAAIRMPQSRRIAAVHAARVSEAIIGTILRVCPRAGGTDANGLGNSAKTDVLGAI